LISEVVLLEMERAEPAEARDIARLQLAAGEWNRAEKQYRSLLRSAPNDPELLTGLGRALFGAERYVTAERTYRRAISAGAANPAVHNELGLVAQINSMDPSLRRLPPEERHRRTHYLASTLLAALQKCSPENSTLAQSEGEIKAHERKRNYLVSAEADLDVFDRLWVARDQVCGPDLKLPSPIQLLAAQLTK
jgi:tetratricopeptide (TPR) repeat protein